MKKKDAILSKILKAIHDGVKVNITYRSSTHEEEQTTVMVSPVKLVLRVDTLYLIAADDEFEETQIFKNYVVENIVNMTTTPRLTSMCPAKWDLRRPCSWSKTILPKISVPSRWTISR